MTSNRVLNIFGTGYFLTALTLTSATPAPPQIEPHPRATAEWFQLNLTPMPTVDVYRMTPPERPSSMERQAGAEVADLAETPPAAVQHLRRADSR
jgi:hypothetical protein